MPVAPLTMQVSQTLILGVLLRIDGDFDDEIEAIDATDEEINQIMIAATAKTILAKAMVYIASMVGICQTMIK